MSNPSNFYRSAYKPFIYSLILAFGTLLGMAVSRMSADKHQSILKPTYSKIDQIMDFIKYKYVDTISKNQLEEQTIEELLSSLDPHSSYIPEKDMKSVSEELDGNFEGIGVEFYIVKDTITIVSAISGGPAESVGLQAGDRIITIDDTIVAGIKIQNKDVMRKLKGVGGTKVKVGVSRGGSNVLKSFTITRGEIPLYSIDATYLIDPKTGYIKINRFSASTISEFRKSLRSLTDQGIERLVLDLRQNPGGYLQAATEIVDELLGGEKMIVYTQGKSVGKMEYFSKNPAYLSEVSWRF
jgi:carboxyl-terminal processing protease